MTSLLYSIARQCSGKVCKTSWNFGSLHHRTFCSKTNEPKDIQKPEINVDTPIFNMENPYVKEKQQCVLCKYNITPNYKNVRLLSQFQSPYTGMIYTRNITGLCRFQQKRVVEEIKKAHRAALMPYYFKNPQFMNDPKLYNPEKPLRQHCF